MASQINPASMIAIASAFPAVGILAVCVRFFIRVAYKHGIRSDDWLILAALFMVIGQGIAIIIGVKQQAVGYPLGTNDIEKLTWTLSFIGQLELGIFLMGLLAQALAKLSLIFFYRRVFHTGVKSFFNTFSKVLAVIIVLWAVALVFSYLFACGSKISYLWGDYMEILTYCDSTEAIYLFTAASDVIFDVILFILPIPLILGLQLSAERRLGILLIFALGALTVVASIIRLVIYGLIYSGFQNNFVGGDPLVILSLSFYWIMFESGLSVIVACLPAMQIWFRKLSVEAVARNVRGIFSVQSLAQSSRKSATRDNERSAASLKGSQSSVSNLNTSTGDIELNHADNQSRRHDAERY